MNRKEWCTRCSESWSSVDHTWDYRSRQIQLSLKYNSNPNATVRHHLMNTSEQIEYNSAHYELWGFNEDGTFEYGKYIIFVTPEEHSKIHAVNLSGKNNPMYGRRHTVKSKLKMRNARIKWWTQDKKAQWSLNHSGENSAFYGRHHTDETKNKMSKSQKGHAVSQITKHKISIANKGRLSGENHPLYGKHHSDETRQKMSKSAKNRAPMSDETKLKIGNASRGRPSAMKGKYISDQTKENIRKAKKEQMGMRSKWYKKYKSLGGNLSWNEFQKMIPLHTDELVNKSTE